MWNNVRLPYRLAVLATLFVVAVPVASAQTLAGKPLPWKADYPQIRTWHEQTLRTSSSPASQLNVMREMIRKGPGGQRLLDSMFKNFSGRFGIDPTIPGVQMAARLSASANRNQAKGYRRALAYAVKIHNTPGFKLVAMEQGEYGSGRKMITDKDIVFEHTHTRASIRMEVKEVRPNTQRSNLAKYKVQIDKMAATQKRTGQLQAYVNRHEIIPKLRDYAANKGVLVYDGVYTSEKGGRATGTRIDDVMSDIDRYVTAHTRACVFLSAAETGIGLYLMYESFPSLKKELLTSLNPETRTTGSLLRTGRHGSMFLGGTALASSGAARTAMILSETASQSRWVSGIAKAGPYVALVALAITEVFLIVEWQAGEMTDRQFIHSQTSLAGSLGGGVAGAWVGAKAGGAVGAGIGSFFGPGPGTAVGGVIGAGIGAMGGGFGGAYAGNYLATSATTMYFSIQDEKLNEEKDRKVSQELWRVYCSD